MTVSAKDMVEVLSDIRDGERDWRSGICYSVGLRASWDAQVALTNAFYELGLDAQFPIPGYTDACYKGALWKGNQLHQRMALLDKLIHHFIAQL